MDILMIGHSRSGKTSYMAGLYKLYGDDPNGFGLWMSDSSKSQKLKHLAANIDKGIYPEGTDIASEYNFWLQYNNSLLVPFNWYDYRGGALLESTKNSKDAQLLVDRINNADALIVFLDGEKITSLTDDDLEEEYEVIMWAIQKAIHKRVNDGNYFPISFIITKGDMYSSYEPLYNSNGIDYFMPLIKSIAKSEVAAGMLGVVEVSKDGVFNVFSPLIFSLYYGMHHYINQRISTINSEIERYNNLDPGLFDDIICGLDNLFGGSAKSDRDMAIESLRKIEEEKNKLQMLDSLSDVMQEIIKILKEKNLIIGF